MKYERNFDLINRKFRELLLPTIAVSIAGNFAILIDAFLISFILGSSYLAVVQSIESFACIVGLFYWMIGMGGAVSYVLLQKRTSMMRKPIRFLRFRCSV